MVRALDALGLTHVVFGNHEDDLEPSELLARVRQFRGVWLGTNVHGFPHPLPTSDVVEVGDRRVGLVGVVMTDPTVYRRPPFGGVTLDDPNEAVAREAARLRADGCHAVIALTHQCLADDRALAARGVVSLILKGHEHDAHQERAGPTALSKSGMDATHAAVVTVELTEPPRVLMQLEPVAAYAEAPALAALVTEAHDFVERLSGAVLVPALPLPLSAQGSRAAQTSMGTFVCSHLRDALTADVGLFNGGGIRGTALHTVNLTLGHLRNELPFDNEVVVSRLPAGRRPGAHRRRRADADPPGRRGARARPAVPRGAPHAAPHRPGPRGVTHAERAASSPWRRPPQRGRDDTRERALERRHLGRGPPLEDPRGRHRAPQSCSVPARWARSLHRRGTSSPRGWRSRPSSASPENSCRS
jgi:hypothetical protein